MDRMLEPSTWAGFAAIVSSIAPLVGAPGWVVTGVTGVLGALAVMLRERSGGQP